MQDAAGAEGRERDKRERLGLAAALLALAACVPLAVHMALGPGLTADEIVQRIYGDLILAYFRTHFADQRALSWINLHLYGGLFELPVQWLVSKQILPWPVYESRHVLTALVGLSGVVATWLTARCIRGQRAAFLAATALLLTPAWVGHSLFNPKDIPFGAAAAFVLYTSVRIALRPAPLGWRDALCASLALGCALGVRSGGMFLIAFPPLAACTSSLFACSGTAKRQLGAALIGLARLVCVFPLAWLLMLIAWPWALQAPLTRPLQAASVAADFDLSGRTRFAGAFVSFKHLPADYLSTWFRVTLPDFYALALICALIALGSVLRSGRSFDARRAAALLTVAAFVVAPVLGVLITRPTLYDGHRHFLFLIPGLAVLTGLVLDWFIGSCQLHAAIRGSIAALAFLLAGLTLYDMYRLHPYEYVYFNRAAGGLAEQGSRFETDYWGASYREGFKWVVDHYDPGGRRKVTVKSCASDRVLNYYRKQWGAKRFVVSAHGTPELYLSITKRDCHKRPGKVIHTVERQGVPLLYVLQNDPQ
jgi:hypothetical protein